MVLLEPCQLAVVPLHVIIVHNQNIFVVNVREILFVWVRKVVFPRRKPISWEHL